jgi:hypothetical protein
MEQIDFGLIIRRITLGNGAAGTSTSVMDRIILGSIYRPKFGGRMLTQTSIASDPEMPTRPERYQLFVR